MEDQQTLPSIDRKMLQLPINSFSEAIHPSRIIEGVGFSEYATIAISSRRANIDK